MIPALYPAAEVQLLSNHSAPGKIEGRDLIVLHITAGDTAAGAIATFRASVSPHRTSAHFVIDRNGTVIQLVDLNDTAWHASAVNGRSIGIEHAATKAIPATAAQYAASAKLVKWLAELLKIPCDRQHVVTHNEASPADGHVGCCTVALDPDRVVREANGTPQGGSEGGGLNGPDQRSIVGFARGDARPVVKTTEQSRSEYRAMMRLAGYSPTRGGNYQVVEVDARALWRKLVERFRAKGKGSHRDKVWAG